MARLNRMDRETQNTLRRMDQIGYEPPVEIEAERKLTAPPQPRVDARPREDTPSTVPDPTEPERPRRIRIKPSGEPAYRSDVRRPRGGDDIGSEPF